MPAQNFPLFAAHRGSGLVLSLFVACAAVWTGCEEEAPPSAFSLASARQPCNYNTDCPDGALCSPVTGTCQQCFTQVTATGNLTTGCGDGQKCSAEGRCVAQCQTDRDCATGTCISGVCSNDTTAVEETAGGGLGIPAVDSLIDELKKKGWLDDDGQFIPPVGTTDGGLGGLIDAPSTLSCLPLSDKTQACTFQIEKPCEQYLCEVCTCYGVYSPECREAVSYSKDRECSSRLCFFTCGDVGTVGGFPGFPGGGGGGFGGLTPATPAVPSEGSGFVPAEVQE